MGVEEFLWEFFVVLRFLFYGSRWFFVGVFNVLMRMVDVCELFFLRIFCGFVVCLSVLDQ